MLVKTEIATDKTYRMETLDSGIGSRSPTPDSSHSQTISSKVTKATTLTNHINNNSHNNTSSTSSNGTHCNSKTKGLEKGNTSSTTAPTSGTVEDSTNSGSASSNSSSGTNNQNNTTSNKTYRDYNNRHSSGHGQYKKYASHQNQHYGYGHNIHYQRYNGGNHRNYGNKHYHSTTSYHHHNHQHGYQGHGYQHHHQYVPHHVHNNHTNGCSNTNPHQTQPPASTNNQNQTQYFNNTHSTVDPPGRNGVQPPPLPTPQVYISSDSSDGSWTRRRSEPHSGGTWSNPSLEGCDPSVHISLNLSAFKQGFYSPSPQHASPATSPSTTDFSDASSVAEENGNATNGVANVTSSSRHNGSVGNISFSNGASIDTSIAGNGTYGPSPNSSNASFSYASFHPSGYYTYPGSTHQFTNNLSLAHHHHQQLITQNMGLLMPADTYLGKADSSIGNGSLEKSMEWSDDATYYAGSDREDFGTVTDRCASEYIYAPFSLTTPVPTTAVNKKRFYGATSASLGKLSPAVPNQRYHYPRKMGYHPHGLPREWLEDLDPEEYVRAFSKFGEVKERPEALTQNPQCDSLSEGIWLKFTANQQTTETFKKKMELWRDVYRIVRALSYNAHFKHDPRNFSSYGLQVVGSTMSGFGSNTSDVDMCLLVRDTEVDQRYEAVDKLQIIYQALSLSPAHGLDNVELIYAKVPILKFRDPKRNLEVDLNCNNYVGIRNTHLLYSYSQADWRLKPLVLVVKLWAHYHGINDAKNMTISSYSLVLMVIHFLQCGSDPPVLPVLQQMYPEKFNNTNHILHVKINEILPPWQSKNTENIGNLLIQFLEYYARKFDYSENAIAVRTGGTIPIKQAANFKSVKNDPHQWKYLCIEEPFDRTNTARSVYDHDTFDKILKIFNVSYQRLQASRNLELIFTPLEPSDPRAVGALR